MLRGQKLEKEESKRAQRKITKTQDEYQGVKCKSGSTEKLLKKSKNKKRRVNTQRQVTNKVMKNFIVTRYKLEMEEPCIFCLKKRQQSNPAVMFARLRSNRWDKPGG